MATVIGTGISTKLDSFAAGKEAALSAYYQIGKNDPGIIIAFISTIFNQEIAIKGIYSVIRDVLLIGCSSLGSISAYGSHRDSVAVFIISSDSVSFSCGIGDKVSKNPRLSGSKAAIKALGLMHKSKLKQTYLMFSDSMAGNSADILRGSQEILGTSFLIMGGGASNKSCIQKTYQYLNKEIQTDAVTGVLISGDIRIGIGKSNSWQPIGISHKVTKAKSNTIKEIDKKKAVEIYEEYFEKSFENPKNEGICKLGINYPIGIRCMDKNNGYLTRVPIAIGENGSLILNGDIWEGVNINLMIGEKDLVLESAKKAAIEAMNDIKEARINFAVMFSDISRFLLLRNNAYKEIDIVKEIIGRKIPILGCYTFGEYVPFATNEPNSRPWFDNHSIVIALFSE
jgi:hypothetical protein